MDLSTVSDCAICMDFWFVSRCLCTYKLITLFILCL